MRWNFLPHQILWIEAAVTLAPRARVNAFEDIAEMCRCPFSAVVRHAEYRISLIPYRKSA